MTLRLGDAVDYDPFADEEEDDVIDSPVKPEGRLRLGEPVEYDPFAGEGEEVPAEETFEAAPEEMPAEKAFEVAPEEGPADVYDPYGDEPQASDSDEPDEDGHSAWDLTNLLGRASGEIGKTAAMTMKLQPTELASKAMGVVGDLTDNEFLKAQRDWMDKHGLSAKLNQYGDTAEKYYDEKLTPAMKASMAKTILASGEEEGFFGEGIKDPWKIAGMIAESIPSTLLSMGGGALITKGLIKTGMSSAPKIVQGALKKLVGKYGIEKVAGIAGGAIGEGGYSGLDNAKNAYEEMMSVDQKKLKRSKAYREVYSSLPDSLSDEKKDAYSRKILAMATAGFVGSITAVTTGIFGAPSGAFMGKLIGGKAGKSLWGNLIKGAIPEGVTEAGEETLQSGMERLIENIATKFLVDPNQELLEGTGEAMASGAVTGFAMGLGMGGAVAVVTPPKVTAKDLLTDGQDVTAEDILLGEDEAERIREKGKGKRFKGPESIEAEEEAGEFSEEELEKLAEKEVPSDSTQRPKGKIPGKKPQGQKPKPPAKQKPGGPPTPPSGVVQKPKTDEGTPEAQERQKFEELVASLTPEEAKSVEDLIKDEKMPIKERLGLMQADLIAYRMKHPPEPGDRRKLGRPEAEARRKDTGFRAIFKQAQGMKESEFVKSGHQAALEELMLKSVKGRKEGEQVLKELEKPVKSGMLDLMRRMGVVVEKDTDIAEGLKTVYARIKAGMMPRKLTSEMSKKELRDAINTDYLTGLRSKQAFEVEDTRRSHVASIDLDSLKYINDTFGHQTGDAMLINFANALKTITEAETYHVSGDEFVVQSDDRVAMIGLLNKRVVDHLNKNPLTVITPDGKKIKYTVGFSYGTAETVSEAERNLARQKKSREITGKRAGRGKTPPGLLEKPAKGKQAGDRGQRAPEKEIDKDQQAFKNWVKTLSPGAQGAIRTFIENPPSNAGWTWVEHLTKAKKALADKLEAAAALRGEKKEPTTQVEKPKEVEDPHWAAVGVVSGGPVAELEKKFVIAWAKDIGEVKKGSDLYYDVVGVLSGGPANRFFAKGLSVTRKPPVLPTGEVDAVEGKKTSIITPGNRRGYSAVYAVVEADDLLPSHNAETFQKNPGYPEGIQERTYHSDTQEQGKVIANAQNLNSLILLSDDPTPTNGPPIITESGVVLGGNSRAMSIQRAYAAQKKTAKKAIKYKNTISLQGAKFGLKPADAFKKEKPVLVRIVYLEKDDVQTLHRMASEFNKTLTQGISKEAEIASMGKNISMATVEKIGLRMANYDKSLRELLSRMDGLEILDWLIKDDVIPPGDKSRYVDSKFNVINEPGKEKIEKAIFGSILDDADLLAAAPKSYINKIERSLSSLARIKARGDQWDITPEVKDALEVATKAKAANLSIREHLKQGSLFGDEKKYSDIARALAYHIEQDTQTRLAGAFKKFAADAMADAKNQTHLFPPRTFSKAFKEAFQAEVAERGTEYEPAPEPETPPKPTTAYPALPSELAYDVKKEFEARNRKTLEGLSYIGKLIKRVELANDWVRLVYEKIEEKPAAPREFAIGDRVLFTDPTRKITDLHGTIDRVDSPTYYKIRGDNGLVYNVNMTNEGVTIEPSTVARPGAPPLLPSRPEPAEAPAPAPIPTEPELMSPDQYVDYVVEKFKADDQDSGITYSERVKIEETGEVLNRDIDAVELLVLIENDIAAYESIRRCMGGNK